MRHAILGAAVALAGAAALAGCGGPNHLTAVTVEPPAGSKHLGKTGRQRSSSDPPTGIPLYQLRPRAGDAISYEVTVRSSADEPIVVTGVDGAGDNGGVLVPERVDEAPVTIAPGATATLTISGRVAGCQYDGQRTSLRDPRLRLRIGDEETVEHVVLNAEVELIAPRRGECR